MDNAFGAPSPKRPRMQGSTMISEEASEDQGLGSQSDSVRNGKSVMMGQGNATSKQESDEYSAEDQELLFDTMAREHAEK